MSSIKTLHQHNASVSSRLWFNPLIKCIFISLGSDYWDFSFTDYDSASSSLSIILHIFCPCSADNSSIIMLLIVLINEQIHYCRLKREQIFSDIEKKNINKWDTCIMATYANHCVPLHITRTMLLWTPGYDNWQQKQLFSFLHPCCYLLLSLVTETNADSFCH